MTGHREAVLRPSRRTVLALIPAAAVGTAALTVPGTAQAAGRCAAPVRKAVSIC